MKVFIQQPVVPEYRIPLFNALAEEGSFEIELHASEKIPGMPSTVDRDTFKFSFSEHPCELNAKGQFYSQKNLKLPESYGVGDVLVYNSNPRFLSNLSLTRQARKRNCRIIAWNHASSASSGNVSSWIRDKVTKFSTDDLLLYTKGEADSMISSGWEESKVFYLNNTVNESMVNLGVSEFMGCQTGVLEARASQKVRDFKNSHEMQVERIFLFCGRLTEKANLSILIRAVSKMSDDLKKTTYFVIIGDGDDRGKYEDEVAEFKLQNNFKFLGAIYNESELAPWFLSADCFVYPGATGLSLNHAMAYGLPVLAHNNSQKHGPEFYYLKENKNGLTYEFENSSDLALKLSSLNTCDYRTFSENAWETMHKTNSFQNFINNFIYCLKGHKSE